MKIEPMLAKPSTPFDSDQWLYEIKWDGERVVATVENEKICKLENRHGKPISERYPEIIGTHVSADQAIIDGEMICFDENGMPSFNRIQHRSHLQSPAKISLATKIYPVSYATFDVMELNGKELTGLPLISRKVILDSTVSKDDGIIPSAYIQEKGTDFFNAVVGKGYEGVMAKRMNSPYLAGKRSDHWLKFKPRHTAIVEITGYNKGEGWRERMGALLISEQGVERGRVGSGLMDKHIDELLTRLEVIDRNNGTVLVKPTIQIEIAYFERTEAGHFRFPSFRRIV